MGISVVSSCLNLNLMNPIWKQFRSGVRKIYVCQKPQSNIYVQPAPASRPLVSMSHPKVTNTKHFGDHSGSKLADKDEGGVGLYPQTNAVSTAVLKYLHKGSSFTSFDIH